MAHAYCRFAQHTPTSFRVTQTPEAAAVSVWSAVHGCLLLEESTPDAWNLGDVHDFIDELIRSLTTVESRATPPTGTAP